VPVLRCDVTNDDDIDALFAAVAAEWGALDRVCCTRSRFAPREALTGDFLNRHVAGCLRDGARRELVQPRCARRGARALMQAAVARS
jgi:NAD(P)-dependent dehydrogenase (short-subunit alcohol dehydrogenase family)